ncbi:hypothetical protein [Bacillus toyonensis]|uniref:hypothetical protein n=1 Tax=Bacillus toyonensis TaxID=155322 RepID=UPI002E1A8825|nr:hypothetical protein [Bacillus toyonensis]
MEKVMIYGFNTGKFVKRKVVEVENVNVLRGNDGLLESFEKSYKSNIPHTFVPYEMDPNAHPELIQMIKIANEIVKNYKNDLYWYDLFLYFKFEKEVLWMPYENGTCIFSLNPAESIEVNEMDLTKFRHYKERANGIYQVSKGVLKEVTFKKAEELLEMAKLSTEKQIKAKAVL